VLNKFLLLIPAITALVDATAGIMFLTTPEEKTHTHGTVWIQIYIICTSIRMSNSMGSRGIRD